MNELLIQFLINLLASFIGAILAIAVAWKWHKQTKEAIEKLKRSIQKTVRNATKEKKK